MTPAKPPRPALAFRAGITGTRDIPASRAETLARQVRDVLALIRQELAAIAAGPETAEAYGLAPGAAPQPALRFLSPLARGADRLGAVAALAEGYALYVPMPFPQPQYEQDFTDPADLAEFQALLAQAGASRLELDGDRATARDSAYEAVGRTVVRNCDLLLAIWDGETDGNGRGGTADTIRYAASTGVPVWWLHATQDAAPIWLADSQDLRDPRPDAASPEQKLRDALGALIRPPPPSRRRRSGVTERIAHAGRGHQVTPMAEYFSRPVHHAGSIVWRAHDVFMGLLAGKRARGGVVRGAGRAAHAPDDAVAAFWLTRFRPADRLAMQYADHYRSGFVWTFLFATLSVVFGAASLLAPGSAWREAWIAAFGSAELLMLLAVLAVVLRGIREDWHEHSIEFRLLAELCRKQQMLGPLAWTLPIVDVRGLNDAESEDAVPERGAWVAWLFAADQRAAPLPTGVLADTAQGPLRRAILDELIAEQLDYHGNRAARDGQAGHRLAVIGEACFFTVFFVLLVKFCLSLAARHGSSGGAAVTWPLGLLATILPALSAAFVGIRAYSEAPLLAVQSRHMVAALKAAHGRVERLGASRPLLSQDLGAEAAAVATLMLQDLDGWARLFRVKTLEAGG